MFNFSTQLEHISGLSVAFKTVPAIVFWSPLIGSGLKGKNDLAKMAKANVRSFLIGESLMRKKNISESIAGLLNWKMKKV